jgi:uncharacterized protein (DUF2141 family)
VPGFRLSNAFPALIAATFATALAAEPVGASTAELVVKVTGVRSDRGTVEYGVYNDPAAFPTRAGRIRSGGVPAAEGTVRFTVTGLEPGTYAVAVFHDENGNGKFDRGLFGIPLEDYGFSNDAPVFFGPPSFEAAAVKVGPEGKTITIRVD